MRIQQSSSKPSALKSKGNMAEYILPSALIGTLLLGGLGWLLIDSNGQQSLLKTAQGEDIQVLQNGQRALLVRQFGKNPNDIAMRINLPNGKQFVLKNLPNSPALSVEVDGVNGTTTKILASLEALIREMEKNGADPNTVSALKNLASKGYLLADDQKVVESVIASCGTDKQCVQNTLFGNQNTLKKVFGLTVGSCANARFPDCNHQSVVEHHGQIAATAEQRESLKQLWPGYEKVILASPEYNYKLENLVVGKQMAQFLDVFHEVQQSKLPSPEIEKLVGLMSQTIFQLSFQTVNNSATVGTVVGFQDFFDGNESSLTLGSSPNIKPTDFAQLVAKELKKTVPSLESLRTNSTETENSATVICKTANGTTQVMPQGTVCN